MPEGKFGGPRPFANSVISINLEFIGKPQYSEGPSEMLKQDVEQALTEMKESRDKYWRSNIDVNVIRIYPPELVLPNNERGFEVEVEMVPDGMMSLDLINKVEEEVIDNMFADHYHTNVIAI